MAERFFNIAHDMLCVASAEGRLLQVNEAWTRALGWSAEELCSGTMDRLVHPDDVASTQLERARVFSGGRAIDFRNRYATRDGGWRWLDWRAAFDPESGRVYAAARDVTDQVAAQRGLELREELLTRVIDDQLHSHDRDQQYFANELHDSVVQHLVAAVMFLETAEAQSGDQDETGPLQRGIQQVRASLQSVRMVMQGLDPFDLGDMDLRSAIIDLGEELGSRYEVRVETVVELEHALPSSVAKLAYRVVREAVVNAGKHASATVVRIDVRSDADQVEAQVIDDGVGLGAGDATEHVPGTGLGLPTMRERVRAHDGQLFEDSDEHGTTIRVILPLGQLAP